MRFRDAGWWWVFIPLLLGHGALLLGWAYGGWLLGGAALAGVGGGAAPWLGGALGLAGWWTVGAVLDWLGYRVSASVTRGRYEFQPLAGPLAGWTLPLLLFAVLAGLGLLCWGTLRLLGVRV